MTVSGRPADRPMWTWPRRLLPIAVAVAVLFPHAGCVGSQPSPAPAAPTLTPTVATPALTAARPAAGAANALEAYRGMWTAYLAAIRIPDPGYPGLSRFAAGAALQVFVKGLTWVQDNGLVGVGEVKLHPMQVTASDPRGTTSRITDCVDTSGTRLVKRDRSPYADTPGGRRLARATVTRGSDGTWKVTSFALAAVGTC